MEYEFAAARKRDLAGFIGRLVAPQQVHSRWMRYGLAVALPFVGFIVNWLVFDLQRAPHFSLFMATVAVTALFGGRGPGLLNTVLSSVLGFLVAPPAWTFRLSEHEDAIRIGLFFLLGCFISMLLGVAGELQRNLNREHSTLETILHTIGDAVITTNLNAEVTYFNDIAEKATGWRLEQALGKSAADIFRIIDEESRSDSESPINLVLRSGEAALQVTNYLLVRRDGTEIPIIYSATPILSQGTIGGGVLSFRDITRQRETNNALIRAEKLATVGKLTATLAHYVNNPLAAASNLLYLIHSAPDLNAAQSYARAALHQVLRAAHFARLTLSFARPSDRRHPVDLCRLIDGVLSLYSNKIVAKNAQIVTSRAPGVQVWVNASEIEQVISNLISNSLDAIPYGGTVHLRVGRSMGDATIAVADNGCGIPREHLPKIFRGFFTTKPDVGVGLGLWVTKRIIEAHNGRVHLRSRWGRGTVVRVSLRAIVQQPASDDILVLDSDPHCPVPEMVHPISGTEVA